MTRTDRLKRETADAIYAVSTETTISTDILGVNERGERPRIGRQCRTVTRGNSPTRIRGVSTSKLSFELEEHICAVTRHVRSRSDSSLIKLRNYSHLPTYTFKADAAQAAAENTKEGKGAARTAAPLLNKKKASKLDFATALCSLASGNYQKVVRSFLKLGSAKDFGDWTGRLVAPGDIAIYGVLCALASLLRSALETQILESSTFGVYLVESYLSNDFKTVLELLNRYSSRYFLDLYLAQHVGEPTNIIRNWAVVLYFQPFASIKLDRMSNAGELFARAIKAGRDIQSTNCKVLLRMRLYEGGIATEKGGRSSPSGSGTIYICILTLTLTHYTPSPARKRKQVIDPRRRKAKKAKTSP
ncbi:hypothetical protein B0H11DRAFT_2162384 [Mycena galericulata]|nr:hypothetical protein B0H11DRAFT_2162384 [Mycena galericulata]